MYTCTKTYDHSEFSCVFRQWRAESHCRLLHGYALSFKIVFEADTLDANNWVIDFGSLKPIKQWLKDIFDHTTVIASDDPQLQIFRDLEQQDLIALRVIPDVGCEKFALYVFQYVHDWLGSRSSALVRLRSVEVCEHGVNSAIYEAS